MENLVIFDLDGVLLSEDAYWDAAGLVVHELLFSPRYWNVGGSTQPYQPPRSAEESRRISRAVFPEAVILGLKARSVNSNWDTSYACFGLYLLELLSLIPQQERAALFPLRPEDEAWVARFRQQLVHVQRDAIGKIMQDPFDLPLLRGSTGFEFINRFNNYARLLQGADVANNLAGRQNDAPFGRYSSSWNFCQNLFQEWYLGDTLYTQEYGHAPAQMGKPGCLNYEQPLLPVEQIRETLEELHAKCYTLGIATGRPREEALTPMRNYDLLKYFDPQHIVTDAEVRQAETVLLNLEQAVSLGKPHPYSFLRAADPSYTLEKVAPVRGSFVVVGDTPSDIYGAAAAGAIAVAVLSGARIQEARTLLEASSPDYIIENMTKLPSLLAQIDDLGTIQRLQFKERSQAELLVQRWFKLNMNLDTAQVTLTPKPVSLNSFNGTYRSDDKEYFFKTHIEEHGVMEEYYNAEILHKAGYAMVMPVRVLHEKGQQMVIYPVIHWPVMFDLMRAVETGKTEQASVEMLAAAEKRECERLLAIYADTLAESSAQENAQQPVHQLFWLRLTGERLQSFYTGKQGLHADKTPVSFEQLLEYTWHINGVRQPSTLGELIERAKQALEPAQPAATVIGHGDAHFGNVFLERQSSLLERQTDDTTTMLADGAPWTYLYFDPAFADRHSPLLDVVKPLFHNVFATWMYFPQDVAKELALNVRVERGHIFVEHNYHLTPVRQAILSTKVEKLIQPLIAWLQAQGKLPADWVTIMQSALMCCPFLTMNLFDRTRMPNEIGWLGMTQAVLMGNNGLEICGVLPLRLADIVRSAPA